MHGARGTRPLRRGNRARNSIVDLHRSAAARFVSLVPVTALPFQLTALFHLLNLFMGPPQTSSGSITLRIN